ncbi:MAG: hypothetical protein LBI59_06740 [Candidatus Accumulibacter sp.]|jgi:hypothetical protein|nr:hypothetical protein [Accumulibacter sp.]
MAGYKAEHFREGAFFSLSVGRVCPIYGHSLVQSARAEVRRQSSSSLRLALFWGGASRSAPGVAGIEPGCSTGPCAERLDFELLSSRRALERASRRLGISERCGQLLLKGAPPSDPRFDIPYRLTHDINLLAFGSSEPKSSNRFSTFSSTTEYGFPNAQAALYPSVRTVLKAFLRESRMDPSSFRTTKRERFVLVKRMIRRQTDKSSERGK